MTAHLNLDSATLQRLKRARKPVAVSLSPGDLMGDVVVHLSKSQLAKVRKASREGTGVRIMLNKNQIGSTGTGVRGESVRGESVRGVGKIPMPIKADGSLHPTTKKYVKKFLQTGRDATELAKELVADIKQMAKDVRGGEVEDVPFAESLSQIPYIGTALSVTKKLQQVVDKIPESQRHRNALEARMAQFGLGLSGGSLTEAKKVGKQIGLPASVVSGTGMRGGNVMEFLNQFWTGLTV